jgi:peptidoglycan/LPS O-acetylase OafA/YrhL
MAALVVLNWHILLAFAPSAAGVSADSAAQSLKTSLAFVAFNGPSAVYLFFVLSSYVLVKRYFVSRKAEDLLLGAAKRLPRLAGPVLVTVLVSCVVFKLDLYFFRDAAAMTKSGWLASFGDAPKVLSPDTANFSDAFMQGTWWSFIAGDNSYDSSLWTMTFEFWGSLMAFALAPIIFFLHDRSPLLSWCAVGIGIFLAWQVSFVFIAFAVSLSLYPVLAKKFRPNSWGRTAILAVSLALLGYGGHAVGTYRPLAMLEFDGFSVNMRQACVAVLASVMLVYAVLTVENPPSWLSGKAARLLGDLSFPLYLVHVPVICSLGSWVILASGSAALGATAAMLGSILVALPLVAFNNWWVRALGGLFDRLRRGGRIAVAPVAAKA